MERDTLPYLQPSTLTHVPISLPYPVSMENFTFASPVSKLSTIQNGDEEEERHGISVRKIRKGMGQRKGQPHHDSGLSFGVEDLGIS